MEERTREIAIEYLEHYKKVKCGMMPEWVWDMAIKALEQEPKTGHWKPYLKEGLRYQCSACDSRFTIPWEYCPHCGAKMIEPQESEDKWT